MTTARIKAYGRLITSETAANDEPISYGKEVTSVLWKSRVGCHSPGNAGP